jgi:hypothetical protein
MGSGVRVRENIPEAVEAMSVVLHSTCTLGSES